MRFTHGITVGVHRPGGEDPYGNPLPGTDHTVEGCGLAPGGSTEEQYQAATVEWEYDLLTDYGADFKAQDTVSLPEPDDETTYQVHGRPQRYKSPLTGWEAGAVVHLKAVQG